MIDIFDFADFIMRKIDDLQIEEGDYMLRNKPDVIITKIKLTYLLRVYKMRDLLYFSILMS